MASAMPCFGSEKFVTWLKKELAFCQAAASRFTGMEKKMKIFNQVQKYGARVVSAAEHAYARAGVAASLALASIGASAQTAPDPFDAAMTEATTKVGAYAAALVGLAAVAVVFMIAIKYVKRIPRAS